MTYTVTEDIFFKNFISSKRNQSERSQKNYIVSLNKFCDSAQETLETIINNCKNQQDKIIEKTISQGTDENGNLIVEKIRITFDVNNIDSYINLYLNNYINYCKSLGNKNNTINQDLVLIRSFLKYYNIQLPTFEKLKTDTKKWNPLSKEDLKFIITDSTLTHSGLISHLKDSGMRIGDALKKTIGEFMEATSRYHNYVDVDEFVDNAPQDMIAVWEFYPEKTERYKIQCITCSGPETCNLILQNLRKIKNEYLPRLNKEKGLNLKLSKNDALFASRKANYKGFIQTQSITNRFAKKNKKLYQHHLNLIEEKIKNGELSIEDKQEAIDKIPAFHAHACRKFFETTIAKNCGNLRICAIMEGHAPPLKTDSSYVKIDASDVLEVYMSALEDLSLENVEAKVYTSEIRKEMEAKIEALEKENKTLREKDAETNSRIDNLEKLILGEVSDKRLSEIHKSL